MQHREMNQWREILEDSDPVSVLTWAAEQFPGKVTLASALGMEAQVLTHLIAQNQLKIPVFTLDTGRLFEETYRLMAKTKAAYDVDFRVIFPDTGAVETMVNQHGPDLFRQSFEKRKHCCHVRKVAPLQRALAGYDAWITGLSKHQSQARKDAPIVTWDEAHGLVKINPLVHWTRAQVRTFVFEHDVPYNPLHDRGFPSIGCASCTRAVKPGEDARAGRWWWESDAQRECGIHLSDGKIVRRNQPSPA